MDVMPGSPGTAPWGAAGAQQTGEADSGAAAGNGENKEPDTQAPITKSATDKEQLKGGDESAPKRARTVEDEDGNGATNGGAGERRGAVLACGIAGSGSQADLTGVRVRNQVAAR